ncbi:importin-5, partial [Trifolium pratense]
MASTSTATERPSSSPPATSQPPQPTTTSFDLQPHVTKILESNGTSSLQETITNFISSKKPSFITIFKSLAHHYPNEFAFKLAELLNLHPDFLIRTETVSILLNIFKESDKLNSTTMLISLKEPLLNSLMIESNKSILRPLCEIIGLVAARLYQFSLGGWLELRQYVCDCFSGSTKLNHMKALIMLAKLPEEVVEDREFWLGYGYYDVLFKNLLNFVNSLDQELRELTFNASLVVIKMSRGLERTDVCDSLLRKLRELTFNASLIDLQYGGEDDLLDVDLLHMVKCLGDLVRLHIEETFNGKEGDVFWCML